MHTKMNLPDFVMSRDVIRAVSYVPLVLSSCTLNLQSPSSTTMYVTLPLGFSTPLVRCKARATTPLCGHDKLTAESMHRKLNSSFSIYTSYKSQVYLMNDHTCYANKSLLLDSCYPVCERPPDQLDFESIVQPCHLPILLQEFFSSILSKQLNL